jgi:hypothetical protein
MLDVINGLANGWVATPVIDAFARRRLFEAFAQQPMRIERLVEQYGANEGHLRTALRLLYELGWLDSVERDCYAANRHTLFLARAIAPRLSIENGNSDRYSAIWTVPSMVPRYPKKGLHV